MNLWARIRQWRRGRHEPTITLCFHDFQYVPGDPHIERCACGTTIHDTGTPEQFVLGTQWYYYSDGSGICPLRAAAKERQDEPQI